MEALFERGTAKVYEEPDRQMHEPEIGEELLAMDGSQHFRGLQFHNHLAIDEEVGAETFLEKRSKEVLSLCRQYPQDIMEHLVYGRALALFQLGKPKEAGKALDVAIANYPLIAIELLMTKHRKPKVTKDGYVTLGGPDQAFLYWKENGVYWTKTPGAIVFLRDRFLRGPRKKQ